MVIFFDGYLIGRYAAALRARGRDDSNHRPRNPASLEFGERRGDGPSTDELRLHSASHNEIETLRADRKCRGFARAAIRHARRMPQYEQRRVQGNPEVRCDFHRRTNGRDRHVRIHDVRRSRQQTVEYSHHFEPVLTGKAASRAPVIHPRHPTRTHLSAFESLGKIPRHPYSDLPDDSWKRHVSAIQVSAKLSIRVTQPMPPRGTCDDRNLKRQPPANRQVFNTFNNPVESNREIPWPAGAVETRRCAKPARRDRVLRRRWRRAKPSPAAVDLHHPVPPLRSPPQRRRRARIRRDPYRRRGLAAALAPRPVP